MVEATTASPSYVVPAADSTVAMSAHASASTAFLATLTEQERAWLRAHPVIRVFPDPTWPPIEFLDEQGNPSGMTKDYLTLIEQRLGIKFEYALHKTWEEGYPLLKRGEIDMSPSVIETPERLGFWAFTKPYMNIPIVIATKQDVTYIGNMNQLAGKRVAVVDGFAVTELMTKDFPAIHLIKVKTTLEGLQRLQNGEVDAFIDNLLVIGYYQTRYKVLNLKIAGTTPYLGAQRMAVRKDWAPFVGILQKALDSIPEAQREEIHRRWVPLRYEHGFDYTLLWWTLGVFAVVLLGFGIRIRAIRLLNHQLEQRVALRTAQLTQANQALESFNYSAAHDLRAPLRGIDGWSLALQEDYGGRLDDQGRQYLQRIRSDAQRMSQLIDDMLRLSKVSAAVMQISAVNLSEMAEKIIAQLRITEPQRQVSCVIQKNLTLSGDQPQLQIALTNLLDNAWKFTSKNPHASIEVGCLPLTAPTDAPVFFVRDNGVGFDMQYAQKLFTPFQRMHTQQDFPGNGIGLATVQRILQRHGGRAWAEAEINKGATFYFQLPPHVSSPATPDNGG